MNEDNADFDFIRKVPEEVAAERKLFVRFHFTWEIVATIEDLVTLKTTVCYLITMFLNDTVIKEGLVLNEMKH